MKGRAEIHEFVQGLLTASGDDSPLADSDSLLFSGRLQSVDAALGGRRSCIQRELGGALLSGSTEGRTSMAMLCY